MPALRDPALSRLAHSLLWPGFAGRTAPDWLRRALDHGLAGVVYFAQNLDPADPDQPRALSAEIHGRHPGALIGVDEEGGIVTRLEAAAGSSTPGNAVLGRLDDIDLTERVAAWTGRLVASAGIDVDLAPTVDVNADPRNPVIGVRSFGADPDVVARHAAAAVRGIQSAGVAACPKHFPGHGDTVTDSHLAPATADVTLEQLHAVHLPPFRAAIEAGAKTLMTAHIRVPALGDAPATLNPTSLRLARDLGFDGVLITDAVDMAAIRGTVGSGPGAVGALAAGADLVCIGNPALNPQVGGERTDQVEFEEVLHAVYEALRSGALPVARAEEAAARLAELSAWRRDHGDDAERPAAFEGADLVARAATVVGDVRLGSASATVVDARTKRSVAVGEASDFFTVALRERMPVERASLAGLDATAAAARAAAVAANRTEDVVLLVNQPQSSPFEAAVQEAVLAVRPDAVVVYAGWPAEGDVRAGRAVLALGASRASAVYVARVLSGSA
ncbi:glycoside hydrolase family 3 N-terminal domain-containing protein [Microbacterium sp. NPDC059771]|uniref:glycoside hydrolase family 3 N-terminal domain-containing protein n=1 Tax=Microbacterium sp. NPDC059771 TaxID=3346941 RepID=UPI00365A2003